MATFETIVRLPMDADEAELLRDCGQWLKAHSISPRVADDHMRERMADLTEAYRDRRLYEVRLQLMFDGRLDDLMDFVPFYDVRDGKAEVVETWTFSDRDTALLFKMKHQA